MYVNMIKTQKHDVEILKSKLLNDMWKTKLQYDTLAHFNMTHLQLHCIEMATLYSYALKL